MKDFFKKITYDIYVDWLIIFSIGSLGLILAIVWSYITYIKVSSIDVYIESKKNVKTTDLDIEKLENIVVLIKEKKKIFDTPSLANIDVRDPSL